MEPGAIALAAIYWVYCIRQLKRLVVAMFVGSSNSIGGRFCIRFFDSPVKHGSSIGYGNYRNDRSVCLTWSDLARYALTLDGFGAVKPDQISADFYLALVRQLLDVDSSGQWIGRSQYLGGESSFKTAYSFFLGSVAAAYMAEKEYGASLLMHVLDPTLLAAHKGRYCDFFAVKDDGTALLFEAKGTTKSQLRGSTVASARRQLASISSVKDTSSGRTYTSFERHIVGSCMPQGFFEIHDIDPPGKEPGTVEFSFDEAAWFHYGAVAAAMGSGEALPRSRPNDFVMFDCGAVEVGATSAISELIEEYRHIVTHDGFYGKIRDILAQDLETDEMKLEQSPKIEVEKSEDSLMSIGRDGIVVRLKSDYAPYGFFLEAPDGSI